MSCELTDNPDLCSLKQSLINQKIFSVYKPLNWTSADVVRFLKGFLKVNKIGHGGTLDPLGEGLMVVAVNEGTKDLNCFLKGNKAYRVTCIFNVMTNTGDLGGDILAWERKEIKKDKVVDAINYWNKRIYYQYPHIWSSVKVNGKKLMWYAKNNIPVNITPRAVVIYKLTLINYQDNVLSFEIYVSKGFYIRSFVIDLANYLNTYGTVLKLIRVRSDPYVLDENTVNVLDLKRSLKNNPTHS